MHSASPRPMGPRVQRPASPAAPFPLPEITPLNDDDFFIPQPPPQGDISEDDLGYFDLPIRPADGAAQEEPDEEIEDDLSYFDLPIRPTDGGDSESEGDEEEDTSSEDNIYN